MSAFEKLEKICAKNPTSILFARLADGLLQQGDVKRATEVCRQGLRYRPSYVAGHVVMGKCHLAQSRYEEARLEFQKVLQLDADHPAALWQLGEIDLHLGWDDLALKHFELAYALDPFNPDLATRIQDLRGQDACVDDVDVSDALDEIDTEKVQSVESSEISKTSKEKEEIGSLVASFGDTQEAPLQEMERTTKRASIATVTLAELYVEQGLIQEALEILEQVVAKDPKNAKVLARIEELRHASQ